MIDRRYPDEMSWPERAVFRFAVRILIPTLAGLAHGMRALRNRIRRAGGLPELPPETRMSR